MHAKKQPKRWRELRCKWGKGATKPNLLFIHTIHPKHKHGLELVSIEFNAKTQAQEECSTHS